MFADLDLTDIDLSKNTVGPAGHYSRPDVTALVFDNRPRRLVITPEELTSMDPDEAGGDNQAQDVEVVRG